MRRFVRQMLLWICVLSILPVFPVRAAGGEEDEMKQLKKELDEMIPCTGEFLFEDGDVVGFIGDSITHVEYTGISYQEFIYNYYITRYPQWNLEFRNLGTSSYTAANAVSLFNGSEGIHDEALNGINKAVIMYGMNEALLYQNSATTYIWNMRRLVKLLLDRGLESEDIILVAPTPYDQTRSSNYREDGSRIEQVDDLISQYVPALKELAEEMGTHYVDLHTPMLWVTEIVQGRIPDDTLTVTDNIHPNAMGNVIAGFFFLYQQGADREVASVAIDEQGEVQAENARVRMQKHKGDRYIRFKYKPNSLPMAVSYEFHEATQYFEIIDAISYERLQVKGLNPDMNYTVNMNYYPVGTYTGAELAKGVNLTDCDLNPGQIAAKEIEKLNQEWQIRSSDYRAVIRAATKDRREKNQEDVEEAYGVWKEETTSLRSRMYAIARRTMEHTHTVEIVSEHYHVWRGQELWHWAVEGIAVLAAVFAAVLFVRRKKRKTKER